MWPESTCEYQQGRHIECAELCDEGMRRERGREEVKVETIEFSFEPVVFEETGTSLWRCPVNC